MKKKVKPVIKKPLTKKKKGKKPFQNPSGGTSDEMN